MERNMNTNKASRNSSACRPIAAASVAHPVGDESDTDCCDCARAPLAQGADRGSCGHDREHRHRRPMQMKDVDTPRDLFIKSRRAENEQLLVSVSDTGVGLPPQQVDKIFDAFFTTKHHGTGMGLRISRSVIEGHAGRLWTVGNSTCGASFYFTLPLRTEAPDIQQ